MTFGWAVAVVVAGLGALLSAGLCLVAMRRMERRFELLESALREHVDAHDDAVRTLEARLDEVHGADARTAPADEQVGADEMVRGESIDAEIAPEIQAAIVAAAVAAAGQHARVSSMRRSKAPEDGSAWSRQGRVLVQGSHNLNPSGRP